MMLIQSIKKNDETYEVTMNDGQVLFVPDTPENRHYHEIQKWLAIEGNNLDP